MKTKIILFAVLLLIVGGLMACEDCLFPDDPAVITKYTIEASAVNGTFTPDFLKVSKGSDATLNLKANDGFDPDSVIINGVVDESLRGKTIFSFFNIDGNIKVKAVCKINKWGILMNGPWKTARWQRRLKSELTIWELDKYPPNIEVETVTFNAKYREITLDSKGTIVGDAPYELKSDVLLITGGRINTIVELSNSTLIVEFDSPYFSEPYVRDSTKDRVIRVTYKH